MKNVVLFAGLFLILSTACNKNEEPAETCTDGIQNQSETGVDCGGPCAPCPSTLCDGNGSTSFYPLALNNSWFYKGSGTNQFTNTVSATATYNSLTYYKVDNTLGGTIYLRSATNGDIMIYNPSTSSELLYVPASPTTGQTWSYPMQFSATRKVISSSTSFSTSSCTYSGCVKIQNFDASGNGKTVMYYKKGVGMVSSDEIYPGVIVTNLNTITLN
ncbi:MAG: hypothetical protein ACOZCO_06810 [Bacteroidota bacterium]